METFYVFLAFLWVEKLGVFGAPEHPQVYSSSVCLMGGRTSMSLQCRRPRTLALCELNLGSCKVPARGQRAKSPAAEPSCQLTTVPPNLTQICNGRSACHIPIFQTSWRGSQCDPSAKYDHVTVQYTCVSSQDMKPACTPGRPLTSTTDASVGTTTTNLTSDLEPFGQRMSDPPSLGPASIAGIAIGAFGLLVILALLYVIISRKRTMRQRHQNSAKTHKWLAQLVAKSSAGAKQNSRQQICVIGNKENDPEYHDCETYAELDEVEGHENRVYNQENKQVRPSHLALASRRRPLPSAPADNVLDTQTPGSSEVSPQDINILNNITVLKGYSDKDMHVDTTPSSDSSKEELQPKPTICSKVSNTSEEDNLAVTGNKVENTEPKEKPLARPVRSHPPLRRHANFNYKPPEAIRRNRHTLISPVREEEEDEAKTAGYEKVWLSHKPKLRRGAKSAIEDVEAEPYGAVWGRES